MTLVHGGRPPSAVRTLPELLDALLFLSRSLTGSHESGILSESLDLLLSATGCERGAAYMLRDDELWLAANRGLPDALRPSLERLPLKGEPPLWLLAQQAVESRTLLSAKKLLMAGELPGGLDQLRALGWEEIVACPISTGRDVFGVMIIGGTSPDSLGAPVRAIIEIACHLIAPQVANVRSAAAPPALGRGFDGRPGARLSRTESQKLAASVRARTPVNHGIPSGGVRMRPTSVAPIAVPSARRARAATVAIPIPRTMPVRPVDAPHLHGPAAKVGVVRPPSDTTVVAYGLNTTVLVVDDDRTIREILREILCEEGYVVETAADGNEALECIRRHGAPGLVLLDLMMPGMDGWHFLAEVRHDAALAEIPVVVMSAVAGAFKGSVAELVRKPVDYASLLATVERCAKSPGLGEAALEGVPHGFSIVPLP